MTDGKADGLELVRMAFITDNGDIFLKTKCLMDSWRRFSSSVSLNNAPYSYLDVFLVNKLKGRCLKMRLFVEVQLESCLGLLHLLGRAHFSV